MSDNVVLLDVVMLASVAQLTDLLLDAPLASLADARDVVLLNVVLLDVVMLALVALLPGVLVVALPV